ncbi:hypothetical protein [Antarctobacter heliothermus]|uniref:Antibiotic biosynthesis monooxygenase n=1 Tax=Antarctobacter heliothermus TaxID=74033 RepID=A0A239IWU6_9RHOB|nr:hypothetical protein [Antarctobacter heliothermus]SNS98081.1 hypothetical protein SAMN04488078_104646 [Antarctobacter heliothermus]
MAYFAISHWETDDWTNEMEALARDKYVPLVKAVGALRVSMVRVADRSFMVVTEYADAATAEAAQAKIAEIRSQAAEELPMKMTAVMSGEVFAAG